MAAISVHIIGISGDAENLAERCADAGLTVSGPEASTIKSLPAAIRGAPGADLVFVVGGIGERGEVPGVIEEVCSFLLPGFGELFRQLVFEAEGARAITFRATAGCTDSARVFGLSGEPEIDTLAFEKLILPNFSSWADAEEAEESDLKPVVHAPLIHETELGITQQSAEKPAPSANEEEPKSGWKFAIAELGAEVVINRREELPEPIEKLAPVVNVLHTAGEFGTMTLPSGRRYGLYGWPDLRRPNAKVLAVSWGDPLAEVIALHRSPRKVGTCIEGDRGLLPSASADPVRICREITGSEPPSMEGSLFAVTSKAVWIVRGRRVFKWDGRRERDDGSPKQVLASLTLLWSNR